MNLNIERVREVIEELEQHRQLIDEALRSLTTLEKAFDAGLPEKAVKAVTRTVTVDNTSTIKSSTAGFACVKHPHSREFSARGQCKLCQSEYMKEYWSKKKKMRTVTPAAPAEVEVDVEDAADFVYSKQQRCPKCGLTTRFRRDRDASPNDTWVCQGAGCELKVGNYKIAVDRDYLPSDDSIKQIS
jgi:hypothetical protein